MGKQISLDAGAEEELRQKIAAGSQDQQDFRNLAEHLFATGRYEEAVALFKRAFHVPLTDFEKATLSVELGWLLYEMGRRTEAPALAQSAMGLLSQEAKDPDVLACLGASQSLLAHCLWFTDPAAGTEAARLALQWLERVMIDAPNFPDIAGVYYDAARLHNLLGSTKDAIVLCEKCLQCNLKDRERLACLSVYGEALRCEGRFAEAEQTLQEVFPYVQGDKGALANLYLSLGLIYRATNRLSEARGGFGQALSALQADRYLCNDSHFVSETNRNLAAVCYDLGNYKEAAKAYREVLLYHPEDDPYRRDVLLWLGHCYLAMGSHTEARECYEKILASPNASEADKVLARSGLPWAVAKVYYESGEYQEAVAAFQEVLTYQPESDPNHWNTLVWLGSCYEAIRLYDKSQDCFEKVLVSPHASEADKTLAKEGLARTLAKTSYESGEYADALAAFEEVLSYHPNKDDADRPNTLLCLGNCYEATGAYDKARDCYEEILASPHALEADKVAAEEGLSRLPPAPKKTVH